MKILAMSYSCNEMGTFNKDPNNINLNDNFMKMILILLAWHIELDERKALKKR